MNWIAHRPGVTSPLMGVRSLAQLEETIAALDFSLPEESLKTLDEASALDLVHPYSMYQPPISDMLSGGVTTRKWTRAL